MEWQPIETAPRDGKEFLAFGSYLPPIGGERKHYIRLIHYVAGDDEWPWWDQTEFQTEDVFSHWMPLPKPPEEI